MATSVPAPPPANDPAAIAAALRNEARRLGFSRVGIASTASDARDEVPQRWFRTWLDRGYAGVMEPWLRRQEPFRRDPQTLLEGARTAVILATDHATRASAHDEGPCPPGRGRVARYAWGDDYHDLLRKRVNDLAAWLERHAPGCKTRGFVDSAPFPEREFGWLAGLGWFGKNTMLIDPAGGSFFLLTVLLTDLELPVDAPIAVDHCGTCTACLDACPTGAFVEPRVLDATKCISSLTIEDHGPIAADLRAAMGDWVFGCDICQEVCPWNRHAAGSTEPTFQPRSGEPTLALAELLALDDAAFRRQFRGSPLLRAKRGGLLRSAAIALGNRPDPTNFDALRAALCDAEPVVRGAAAWALGRWIEFGVLADRARATLTSRLPEESDPDAREEIDRAIRAREPAAGPTG